MWGTFLKLVESDTSNFENFSSLPSVDIPAVYMIVNIPFLPQIKVCSARYSRYMYLHNKSLSKPQLTCPQAKTYPKPVDSLEQLCTRQNKQENKCN